MHEPQIEGRVCSTVTSALQPRRHVQVLDHPRVLGLKPLLIVQQRGQLVTALRRQLKLRHRAPFLPASRTLCVGDVEFKQ